MLYDPKWEVMADPFTLASLIAWLEKQSADDEYCYLDNGFCLLGQYFSTMGISDVSIGDTVFSYAGSDGYLRLPNGFERVAWGYPRTFGGALKRARKATR